MSNLPPTSTLSRRAAIQRVAYLLGGVSMAGGSGLLAACDRFRAGEGARQGSFSAEEVALLDEVADTILPDTDTPGARAAGVGPFIAFMVDETYDPDEQATFREGLRRLEEEALRETGGSFLEATPEQRLALLERLDREQKEYMDARAAAGRARREAEQRRAAAGADTSAAPTAADSSQGDAYLPDQRRENAPVGAGNVAPAITADAPPHYLRMIKELTLLGYFTSEVGYTQAQRYEETPGRFDPCVPYAPGDRAWAPHA